MKMNENCNENTIWKCNFCSYKNKIGKKRCLVCMKSPVLQNTKAKYPKEFHLACEAEMGFFSNPERVIFLGTDTDEELETFDKADRENLIITMANEENISLAQAKLVIELMDLNYSREVSVDAAKQCSTFESAQAFLKRQCLVCDCMHPESKMESMYYCEHSCCVLCAKQYFTTQVKEKNVLDIVCPVCGEPKLGETVKIHEYFATIDSQLRRILEEDVYELLQIKLRDFSLSNDPDFYWCPNCKDSFGFYAQRDNRPYLTCPCCRFSFCVKCKAKWEKNHDCLVSSKSQYDFCESELDRFLHFNYTECPKCGTRYDMIRGGCIHFKCFVCKHNWCNGCGSEFLNGKECGVSEKCHLRGLHAHHPRNCFYFGRDKDYKMLQQLLRDNNIKFESVPLSGYENNVECPVNESKDEVSSNTQVCGKPVEEGLAGLCIDHYREYLSFIVASIGLDTVDIMDTHDLISELDRNDIQVPQKHENESDSNYYHRLKKFVVEKLPLRK